MPPELRLPYAPPSVGEARRLLRAELEASGFPAGAVHDASVVVSELLANALRHGRPLLPGYQVQVGWRIGPEAVDIRVTDGGGATQPHIVEARGNALGGRGLAIVRTLCTELAVQRGEDTVTVRARVPAVAAPEERQHGPGQESLHTSGQRFSDR